MNSAQNFCDLCHCRQSAGFSGYSDSDLETWRLVESGAIETPPCSACFGILQSGHDIVSKVQSELELAGYEDVFACQLSVILSADILFQTFVEKLSRPGWTDSGMPCTEFKDLVRGLIYRATITEQQDTHMPKLFVDVRIDGPSVQVPDELMKAVNQAVKHKPGNFKKFRTRESVNIADVQQFIESTKGSITKVYKALFPSRTVPDGPTMRSELREAFVTTPSSRASFSVSLKRETLYLSGKYVKASREFGQSQWDANETSIAESICPVVCELLRSPVDKCQFSASGREDMDVRMLGSGRAFVLQVGDAKRLKSLTDSSLAELVIDTGDVIVRGLKWADKGVMDWLHWSTEQHTKIYQSVVWTEQVLPSQSLLDEVFEQNRNIKVFQKTPLRVLHRRTEHTREKTMYSVKTERINDHFAIVTLRASAGAYIKEFIHSDLGRTTPSFCDLVFGTFVPCDILQLDVLEVEQDESEDYVPVWNRS